MGFPPLSAGGVRVAVVVATVAGDPHPAWICKVVVVVAVRRERLVHHHAIAHHVGAQDPTWGDALNEIGRTSSPVEGTAIPSGSRWPLPKGVEDETRAARVATSGVPRGKVVEPELVAPREHHG